MHRSGRDEHHRSGAHLVCNAVNVIAAGPLRDVDKLIKVGVGMRLQFHPLDDHVHHQHHCVGRVGTAAHAGPDFFLWYLLPAHDAAVELLVSHRLVNRPPSAA
jgi:hypothetical protein